MKPSWIGLMKMVLLALVLMSAQGCGQLTGDYGMHCNPDNTCNQGFCACIGDMCVSCGHWGEPTCPPPDECVDPDSVPVGNALCAHISSDPEDCGHVGDKPCKINGQDFCYQGSIGPDMCLACGGYEQFSCDGYCTYGAPDASGICRRTQPFEIEAVDYPYYVVPSGEKDLRVHWSGQPEFPVRIELRPKDPNGRTAFHTFDEQDEQNPLFFQSAMSLLDCNEGTTMQYDVVMIDNNGIVSDPYPIEFYCSPPDISGTWTQKTCTGSSNWIFTKKSGNTYDAQESGLGGAKGAATYDANSRKIHVDWETPTGDYKGTYDWILTANMASGDGDMKLSKKPTDSKIPSSCKSSIYR